MSVVAVTWVQRLRVEGLTLANKAVLSRLADAANADWECWPSQQLIAEDLACSVRTVIRHLDALEALGLISRTYIQKDNGARKGTLYKLHAGIEQVVIEAPMADTGDDEVPTGLSDKLAPRTLPVENPEILSDKLAPRGQIGDPNGGHPSDNQTPRPVEKTKNPDDTLTPRDVENSDVLGDTLSLALRKNPNLRLNYSSSSVLNVTHQAGSAAVDDDDFESAGVAPASQVVVAASTVTLLREWHPGLDAVVLVDRLQRSGRLDLSQLDIERAVAEILQGSARPVGDPVAYISKAILAEPWRWARDYGQAQTPRGVMMSGSSRPPTAEECAERGHQWVGEWREACAACGTERPGWRDDRDRDNVKALRGVS